MNSSGAATRASSRRRLGYHSSAATGPAASVPSRAALLPTAVGIAYAARHPSRYRAAPARSAGSERGVAASATSDTSTTGHRVESPNGNVPPSGNATASSPTGTSEPAITAAPQAPALIRRGLAVSPAIPYAAPTSAENSAATGLQSAVSTPIAVATPGLRRERASAAAVAGSIPNANVSRPVYRFVAVAAPNQSAPSHPSSPNWSRASSSNSSAVPTVAIPAASCGVSAAAIGREQDAVPDRVVAGVPPSCPTARSPPR